MDRELGSTSGVVASDLNFTKRRPLVADFLSYSTKKVGG